MPSHEELRAVIAHKHKQRLDASRTDAVKYQHSRGKLTARERIEQLCDESSFCEFGGLAIPKQNGIEEIDNYADALVTGRAKIDDRPLLLASADFTINGGSNGSIGLKKMLRCYELALAQGSPMVQLLEGVGHRISEGLDSRLFAEGVDTLNYQAQLSGWVPSVAAILGQGFAAMTVVASLCDFVVMVRGMSTMGIAPPPLVKAATGAEIDAESLGGADFQASQNGIADAITETEQEAFNLIKQYLAFFPSNASEPPPIVEAVEPDPHYSKQLSSIIPTDMRTPYNVKHVIYGLVDHASVLEIKAGYAKNMVCCLARIDGRPIGIIANQPNYLAGSLDSPACEKASHFICLCDAFGIPLLSLMDLPGFLVGKNVEQSKLARRSARLIYELSRITVPSFTVVLRKAYGAAYMGMNGGRSFGADLSLAWPTAEFAAMHVETAIGIAYKRQIAQADDAEAKRQEITEMIRGQLGPVRAAEGFGIDDAIMPEQTREQLRQVLAASPLRKQQQFKSPRVRGIPPI